MTGSPLTTLLARSGRRGGTGPSLAWCVMRCALLGLAFAASASAQTVRTNFPITNGTVNAEIVSGSTLYIGGSFTTLGSVTGAGVPVDSVTGAALPDLPQVVGQVNAVVSDGEGGWYIGGLFTSVAGAPRSNLAHILVGGSLDAWDPEADGQVLTLARSYGIVYAGGAFANVGGHSRSRIAALDGFSGNATNWNPSSNDLVRTLVVHGGTVYAGGRFTTIGGQPRNRIAALSVSTGTATSWNPGANSDVDALALDGGLLFVGGNYTSIGGASRTRLAALDTLTGTPTSWNPGANSQVNCLAIAGGTVYAGGVFSVAGGTSRSHVAAIDEVSGLATSWDANASSTVDALALDGSTLYLGGDFLLLGTSARSRLGAVDLVSGAATSWDPSAYSTVQALVAGGGTVYVGGNFTGLGGVHRNNLAAIDIGSGTVTAWDPNVDSQVLALAMSGSTLYVGGQFANVGGIARDGVAAVDALSGGVLGWNPACDGLVSALAVDGATVFAGGQFGTIGGQSRSNIAALDATSGTATAWDPESDDQIITLLVNEGVVYAGGTFSTIGGQPRDNLAALDETTGLATPWNPGPNGTIRALAATCGTIYVGGFYTTISGQSRNRVAALDATTASASPWDPNANGPVYDVSLNSGLVYVSGVLNVIGGQFRNRIASIDPLSGTATAWDPNASSVVRVIAGDASEIYLGGGFSAIGTTLQSNIAAVSADNSYSCPAITISPSSLPAGIVGTPFSQTITAAGGTSPTCFWVTSGTLPPGLWLDSSTGLLSGVPSGAGMSTFTVTATDARGCTANESYNLATFDSSAISRIAPATGGLCVNPAHPCVSVPFTYARAESGLARSVEVVFQIDTTLVGLCAPATPGSNVHLGPWFPGSSILQITPNGGGSFTVDATSLGEPCGNTAGGELFTIDLHSVGADGLARITVTSVRVRDCSNNVLAALPGAAESLLVQNAPVVIQPASLPGGVTGTPYPHTLTASPGTAPFTYSLTAGALPTGIALSPGGVLSGTLSAAGTFAFTIGVSDVFGCVGSRSYTVTVTCPTIALSPATLPAGTTGHGYTGAVGASGGSPPYAFTLLAGTTPPGLTFAGNGALGGIPTTPGSYAFTVGVTDTFLCSASLACSLTVRCPNMALSPSAIADRTLGVAWSDTIAAGSPVPPVAWTVASGALPDGLSLGPDNGVLSGMTTAAGTFSFTLSATDAYGCSASHAYTVTVFPGAITSTLAADPTGLCLSTAHPSVSLPFVYVRTDSTPVRAVSVTLRLDPARLALATPLTPDACLHVGSLFAGDNVSKQITLNPDSSWTVDLTILGSPCGPTAGGQVFLLDVAADGPDGAGLVTVTAVHARDCSNVPVPVNAGAPAGVTINTASPTPIVDLIASAITSGNGPRSTEGIQLTWTPPGIATARLYRAPFGSYPEYDDGGGTAPDSSAAPGAPWVLVAASASPGFVDTTATRGFWYYLARVSDACGNFSRVSNRTTGTLNYLLGDVSDGYTPGQGNNSVGLEDISLLGAHYGISGAAITAAGVAYLDVGPTTDGQLTSRPTTDDQIDFEDLMVFTDNFQTAATMPMRATRANRALAAAEGPEQLDLAAPSLVEPGADVTATLSLRGAGRLQGLSARLAWDASVVQPVRVASAGFLETQNGIVLTPGPGRVDAALLGARDVGMTGAGDVARVTFRVLRTGDARISLAQVEGRDAANRPLPAGTIADLTTTEAPGRTELLDPAPNPFNASTALMFSLATSATTDLSVFSVDGRRVRSLVHEWRSPGVYHLSWDGHDDSRAVVAPGVYYLHLTAGGIRVTRRLVYLR